ncbi:uncharacterized protein LOC127795830 isoform X2 [Diospyros lotus]|uniref:uncharacterized protein LOC127795830 isoform X2 n=1 Tax=Diospyros lotus TaxID=55363 RepID=UPI00225387B2|nr:uncharacterized protein LOC127795830 isoform X2 [Diospyros lotus]
MARQKLKSLITSFTSEGDYLAILYPTGIVKIWNTKGGNLFAEWAQSNANSEVSFSCMACSFIGKKRRKEGGTFLLALGSLAGEVLAVDVLAGERKWNMTGCHAGISGLSFTNGGRTLHMVSEEGMAYKMNSETGEVVKQFKVSKRHISSTATSHDEKALATALGKVRIFSWETGKELLKFTADEDILHHISIADEVKTIITSGSGQKHLQVWKCDLSTGAVIKGPVLSMRRPPIALECKNGANEEVVVLSVSESGVAYLWNLKTISEEEITPTKVTVKPSRDEMDLQNDRSTRKSRFSIMAARLHALESDGRVTVLIAYGSTVCPQFSLLDISSSGEDIVVSPGNEMKKTSQTIQENGALPVKGLHGKDLEAVAIPIQSEKANKRHATSDLDLADTENKVDIEMGHGEPMQGRKIDVDLNEPTMGEKLANLTLLDNSEIKSLEENHAKPPSADSVHVLLKQALHADDRALLLNCLSTQDEKVIANSVSLLNPAHVLKLLNLLITVTESRGAVLARALPWLRSLLLEHASGIMSQESSLIALNSLYQLIESRVSTFHPALQLCSRLDLLYKGTDDGFGEDGTTPPIVYQDKDESEEEPEGGMETDEGGSDLEPFNDVSDIEGSDEMDFD